MKTMKISGNPPRFRTLFTVGAAMLLMTACASTPPAPAGSAAVRSKLTMLRTDAELSARAPNEIQVAELAVIAAEQPEKDTLLARHRVLIADQQVDIARSWAQSRLYEDQRAELSARSEAMRLDSRTREAESARSDAADARTQTGLARADANAARDAAANAQDQASAARNAAAVAQSQTTAARNAANAARTDADRARAEADDLQRQINELNAQVTDRGIVVTLGDVLFATGNAELRGGTANNLDRLAAFLNQFDTRTVMIEGHTDNVGSDTSNQILSQRRADSVEAYLMQQGVAGSRIDTAGRGEGSPVASNETETGRQQNRRVEVIISKQ